ncbi:MAG: hypothetical protein H7145_15090 [Akkermansiaceae bacterium]|nr:hypothetical protein [Armatimonadota bacterium]
MADFLVEGKTGHYPIVYVRGFTPNKGSREDAFYDAYYGFAETSVEKRQTLPRHEDGVTPWYQEPELFEGQLIRFLKEEGYADATNGGLALATRNKDNPARSLFISRFYDTDVLSGNPRDIIDHAADLQKLVCEKIPKQLKEAGVNLGTDDKDYRVILIAHSMGGLVARCFLQNLLPHAGQDPERWVHRLVTIATPHRGIELDAVPDALEEVLMGGLNALDSAIFRPRRMRDYLKLPADTDLADLNGKFAPEKCFCLIGSDHENYSVAFGVARRGVGTHSDGLVKQSNAYIKGAYFANVHRAHSGRRGIVNSFESYQNIRRFLFGDTKVSLTMEDVKLKTPVPPHNITAFYDVEFSLSVRGTGVFLHQRRQNPCENAMRYERTGDEFCSPKTKETVSIIPLHTAFMDTRLQRRGESWSHFSLGFRISEHQVRDGFLWDHEYPERTIYSETLEVRVGNEDATSDAILVEYRWLSDNKPWQPATIDVKDGRSAIPLRDAQTFGGTLQIRYEPWGANPASEDSTDTNFIAAILNG